MKKYFFIILFLAGFAPAVSFASAADCANTGEVNNLFGSLSFFPHYCTASDLIFHVISLIFAFIGVISVLMIIIGGFQYVGAGYNPKLAEKAKSTIQYAVIGLIVAVLSYSIVTIVVNFVGSGGNSSITSAGGSGSGGNGSGSGSGAGGNGSGNSGGPSATTIKQVGVNIVPSSVAQGVEFIVTPQINGGMSGNGTIDVYAISPNGDTSKPLCDPNLTDGQMCTIGTGSQDNGGFFTPGTYKINVVYYDANGNRIGQSSGADTVTITDASESNSSSNPSGN